MTKALWKLAEKESAKINSFEAKLPQHLRERLMTFGLTEGETVCCLKRTPWGGPRVYQISDSVFSLDSELAEMVLVRCA